jgi:hypothetical protein
MPNLCAEAVRESALVGLNVCLNPVVESSRSQSFIEESAPPDTRLLRLACFYDACEVWPYILFSISIASAFTPA